MARTAVINTGHPDVEARGNSIRVFFMFKRARHSHTLKLEPTRNNIKHAISLRGAAQFATTKPSSFRTRARPRVPRLAASAWTSCATATSR